MNKRILILIILLALLAGFTFAASADPSEPYSPVSSYPESIAVSIEPQSIAPPSAVPQSIAPPSAAPPVSRAPIVSVTPVSHPPVVTSAAPPPPSAVSITPPPVSVGHQFPGEEHTSIDPDDLPGDDEFDDDDPVEFGSFSNYIYMVAMSLVLIIASIAVLIIVNLMAAKKRKKNREYQTRLNEYRQSLENPPQDSDVDIYSNSADELYSHSETDDYADYDDSYNHNDTDYEE